MTQYTIIFRASEKHPPVTLQADNIYLDEGFICFPELGNEDSYACLRYATDTIFSVYEQSQ